MKTFELIEHTADIGIRAFGATEKETFQNAATGMFSLICDLATVTETEEFEIEVEAEDRETLLVEWLNELLYIYDSRRALLKRFEVIELEDTRLRGMAYGEPLDLHRHVLATDIKAVTYYMLKVKETPDGWVAEVIFDV
ncbi:MAG: archease [Actinomycetota bacterium]